MAKRLWVIILVAVLAAGAGAWVLWPDAQPYGIEDKRIDTGDVTLDTSLYLPEADEPVPAVLLAHGFGGSKESVAEEAADLAGRGYAVLTWTARGFGRSTGEIHLNSAGHEVKDARHLLDRLAERPEIKKDAAGDPRVGVVGGSYGGALALNLAGHDQRVDAIVPQITYNDLANALLPEATGAGAENGVFKKAWAGIFFGAGGGPPQIGGVGEARAIPRPETPAGTGDPQCGRFAKEICDAYLDVAESGRATKEAVRLLRASSPAAVLDRIEAPTLLVQGLADSLFPLAEADANAKGITNAPVRVAWFSGGHDGEASRADDDRVRALTAQWLDHHLLGEPEAPGTSFTYSRVTGFDAQSRGPATAAFTDETYPGLTAPGTTVAVGGRETRIASPPDGSPAAITALPGLRSGSVPVSAEMPGQHARFDSEPLAKPVDLAGSPTIDIAAASPTGEAVLFVKAYDVGPDGQATLIGGQAAPVRLTGPATVTLPAMVHRFDPGHRLRIVVAASDQAYATPPNPEIYTVKAASKVTIPRIAGAPLDTESSGLRWTLAAVAAAIIAVIGGAIIAARLRRGRRERTIVAKHADRPLVVRDLQKVYQDGFEPGGGRSFAAVTDVGFTVERGRIVGLLGPNGAGKTTALRVLMGLIRPTGGEILVFGHPLSAGAPVLSRLGALVEGPGFLPHLSGLDNLRLFWQATGRPPADARLDEVLEIAKLGEAIHRRAGSYSHGMKQRLAIAQAMLGMPELLVLDEPTDGLDPPQIAEMREVLRGYATDGRAVLLSSHLLAEVEAVCTDVVVVSRGRVVAAGPVEEVASRATGDGWRRLEDAFLDLVSESGTDPRERV